MRKFEWCLEKGKLGDKHRGLRKTEPNSAEADRHIRKALHNLDVMAMLHAQGFDDWTLSAAFYATYHSSLAILYELATRVGIRSAHLPHWSTLSAGK